MNVIAIITLEGENIRTDDNIEEMNDNQLNAYFNNLDQAVKCIASERERSRRVLIRRQIEEATYKRGYEDGRKSFEESRF